jgi:hypothetical protein
MNYNLSNIQTAPSYDALKRNGFADLDVLAYYGTPVSDRGTMFKQIKAKNDLFSRIALITQPQTVVKKDGTQKCTGKVDIDSVRDMALVCMGKDYTYRGVTYNMNKMGWKFAFNDRKIALGLCSHRRKTIYLSTFFIESGSREMKMWENTMIHEIAHAINAQIGGRGHSWQWRDIFIKNGGDGKRTNGDTQFNDLIEKPVSKYTTICANGHASPSHKRRRNIEDGRISCGKCCSGRFDNRFLLKQIQNY